VTTFALIASPLVGPAGWRWLCDELRDRDHTVAVPELASPDVAAPVWAAHVERVSMQLAGMPELVLVGHSAAGRLLPLVAERIDVRGCVFLDAQLPVDLLPPADDDWFLAHVRTLAREGRLPPWSDWWSEAAWQELVPDPARRAALERALPRVSLASVEEVPPARPTPPGAAYLRLSRLYEPEEAAARALAWPVARLDAQHLHFVVDERAVADALERLADQL
jgi:hypothetical protein